MDRAERPESAHHLMLYDGTCAFCHASVRFVLAHDRQRVFRFASLEGAAARAELSPHGGLPADLTTVHVLERLGDGRAQLHQRAGAVLFIASTLGWPWRLLGAFRVFPRAWLDAAYDIVARHRHGILGRSDACLVPRPEDRERFLDAGDELER